LLTQNGAWFCETSGGEGEGKYNVTSALIALKTAPDEATIYQQSKFVNDFIEFDAAEVGFIKIGTGGLVSWASQLIEFRDTKLGQSVRQRMAFLDNVKKMEMNAGLTEMKSNFALDGRSQLETPMTYSIKELTTDTFVSQNSEGQILKCVHGEVSTLYNDFGLITK